MKNVLILLDEKSTDALPFKNLLNEAEIRSSFNFVFADPHTKFPIPKETDILVTHLVDNPWVSEMPQLKWIHCLLAGLDKVAKPNLISRGIQITGSSGVHGPNIAEHVLAMMLMFSRRMPFFYKNQMAGQWSQPKGRTSTHFLSELTGQCLGLFGFGHIGQALAERAKVFSLKIVALTPDGKTREGAPQIDKVYRLDQVQEFLETSDHICVTAPATPKTFHFFNEKTFSQMKTGAYFYNIARGSLVDEDALVENLRNAKLAGAGLDVFEEEPLSKTSPLWKMENVILTPHVAGWTPLYYVRAAEILRENLKNFLGSKDLRNLFNPSRGY